MNLTSVQVGLPLISEEAYYVIIKVLHFPMMVFSLSGLVTNSLNMLVFVRQGVTSDSVTVSLFVMSLSDFAASLLMFPQVICYYLDSLNLPSVKSCYIITSMATTYPHIVFGKVTCLIQTYISVERAYCVVFPLKVKRVIKTRNTVIINIILCIVTIILFTPYPANLQLVWVRDNLNSTRATFVFNSVGLTMAKVNYINGSFIIPNTAIVVNSVATVVIVARLHVTRKWRKTLSSAGAAPKSQKMSSKSLETSKTVIVITSVYLVSLICGQLPAMTAFALPDVTQEGLNKYLYDVIFSIRFDIEAMHSTVNLFFYFKMSSKYRQVCQAIFMNYTR
ncbi:uncharacterized protein LOC106059381 [Biomphalaria glabrata]|uniref:Uncharacterized protein LOC106059381 n=1 Tax=Biomphalaria glabrata TaxID=6526 RepID=A0A9U8E4E0_BIOGL|nr:uncharacterized protein LOC106059381 [Biomphalaria glabrata]